MLLQLENTNKESINKLLNFAKQNDLQLSLIDDNESNYFLPGKPLSDVELSRLIEKSRKSGNISMQDAHSAIRKSFDAGN
jgi:molybdenum cofactor biosynthesis enzyme MoaA